MRNQPNRRLLLGAAWVWPALLRAEGSELTSAAALRAGGVVVVIRHAEAPGVYDPPEFELGDCSTQRNLGESGREQARRIGRWFQAQGLRPARVRSSPWCRCLDTATLAFGRAEAWASLGSPVGRGESINSEALRELAAGVARAVPGRFDVWVTHQFVISALAGMSMSSGEGLVLRAGADGRPGVVARLPPA